MHIALLITTWAAGCASFTQTRARNVSWNRYSQKASTTSATQPRHRRTAIRVPSKSKESPNESSRDAATRLPDIRTSADDVAANLSLVSLITAFTAIQWARAAIYYCVDFSSKNSFVYMNAGLDFGVEGYGLLATAAFAVPFTLVSLGAGTLVDQSKHRGKLVALATAGVGVSLVAQAAVPSAVGLGATRALQGAFSAAVVPAAYSLLADLFAAKDFASANSKFTTGIYVGGAVASLSTLVDEQVGWRTLSLIIGVFAFAAAGVAALTIPEPRASQEADAEAAASSTSSLKDLSMSATVAATVAPLQDVFALLQESPTLQLLFAGSMLRFCAGFTILAWLPPFMHDAFPSDIDRFSVANAAIKSGGGFAATVAGAALCTRLGAIPRIGLKADAVVPAVGSLAATGVWALLLLPLVVPAAPADLVEMSSSSSSAAADVLVSSVTTTDAATAPAATAAHDAPFFFDVNQLLTPGSFEFCMGSLAVAYLVAENWLGPTVAILQRQVPPESRGAALGLFGAATQVVGNAAPAVVGTLSAGPVGLPLRDAFLGVVGGSYVLSSALFAAVAASLEATDSET